MSMFKFDYVKEEDLKPKVILLSEGQADFRIDKVHTIDKEGHPLVTKDGRSKISLQLTIKDSRGVRGVLYQDLTQAMAWMVKGLSDSLGMPKLYNVHGLDLNVIIGKTGKCMIKTKQSPGYDDKSVVHYFIAKGDAEDVKHYAAQQQQQHDDTDSIDDIPF